VIATIVLSHQVRFHQPVGRRKRALSRQIIKKREKYCERTTASSAHQPELENSGCNATV
jgi:hypothetical protein